MESRFAAVGLAVLLAAAASCAPAVPEAGPAASALELDGASFQVADAAVYSNCLSLTFAVRAFEVPEGMDPQAYFPPARSIDVAVTTDAGGLPAEPLGGGGGGGGSQDDGRIWMEQRALFSLERAVPEGGAAVLAITVMLDDDFGHPEPLGFNLPVVAGPGGGACR